jgi:hypothetical protein
MATTAESVALPVQAGDNGLFGDLPQVELEFLSGRGSSRKGQRRRIEGAVSLLGASRRCDLCLNDESVSHVHASLVLTPRGLWVIDLLGRGSVQVNDRRAYWKQIYDGARVQIGRFQFCVRFDAARGGSVRRVGDDEAPSAAAAADRQSAPGGLSESSAADLIRHMTDTQNRFLESMSGIQQQFFEHSQNQMRFMAEILAHLGRSQQESARKDLARIEEITQELEEVRLQLARQPLSTPARRQRKRKGHPAQKKAIAEPVTNMRAGDAAPQPTSEIGAGAAFPKAADALPGVPGATDQSPSVEAETGTGKVAESAERDDPEPDLAADDKQPIPPFAADAHARLTERMARLAQERNAVWRRILATFTGTP